MQNTINQFEVTIFITKNSDYEIVISQYKNTTVIRCHFDVVIFKISKRINNAIVI